jgi:hypothetical protein
MEIKGISDALQALKYSNAVEVIDEVLVSNPAATVAESWKSSTPGIFRC